MKLSGPIPRNIGPYRPLKKLGEGGMGVVYCAQDTRDERLVALKVISGSAHAGSAGDDSEKRFLREARILESLRHPNVVSFFEVGSSHGQDWFAMELLSGKPLSAFAKRPWPELLPLFVQVARGMEYLAARAIVHRDLSPDNVFIVDEGGRRTAKILDFGIAKDTTAAETLHNFTKTGLLMGKPPYWSPEQIGNLGAGEVLDFRSDLYTLGIIFHRILTGSLPFEADTPVGFISLHLSHPAPEIETLPGLPEVPPPVRAVIRTMMEKDRRARPQSWAEIAAVFEEAIASAPPAELPPFEESPFPDAAVSFGYGTRTKETAGWGGGEATGGTDVFASPVTRDAAVGSDRTKATKQLTSVPGVADSPTRAMSSPARATATGLGEPTAATAVERRSPATATIATATPAGSRRASPYLLAAAAVLVVAAVAAWLVLRPRAEEKPPSAGVPAVAAPTGVLALHTTPWARVARVTREGAAAPEPLAETLTPALLTLAPGRYTVELESGADGARKSVTVTVAAGSTESVNVAFGSPEAVARLLD